MEPKVKVHRILGRTGFKVSGISMGTLRVKESMIKYNHLGERSETICRDCKSLCLHACEYQVNIPAQLQAAHRLLTLA